MTDLYPDPTLDRRKEPTEAGAVSLRFPWTEGIKHIRRKVWVPTIDGGIVSFFLFLYSLISG